jgi:hypothetical protein
VAELRAADVDRQTVADRLRVALDEGRLDLAEFDARLQRAYAARTYTQLNQLLADLPPQPSTTPAASRQSTWRLRWICCLPIPVREITTRP